MGASQQQQRQRLLLMQQQQERRRQQQEQQRLQQQRRLQQQQEQEQRRQQRLGYMLARVEELNALFEERTLRPNENEEFERLTIEIQGYDAVYEEDGGDFYEEEGDYY